jgi:hypothetical protein
MSGTLSIHFDFVIARCGKNDLGLILGSALLHCDKPSPFGHIGAAPVGFVVHALIVSGDNGLNGRAGIVAAGRFDAARPVPAQASGPAVLSVAWLAI